MTINQLYEQGRLDAESGRYGEALQCYLEALKEEPDNAQCHSEASVIYMYTRRIIQAEPHGKRAYELAPDDPVVICNYGMLLSYLGQRDEARALFERVIRENPELDVPRFRYGQVLTVIGDLKRAEEVYRDAIVSNPELGHNYYRLGRLVKLQEDDPAFIALKEQMSKLEKYTPGRQVNFHLAYGYALTAQGKSAEAFEQYMLANSKQRQNLTYDGHVAYRRTMQQICQIDKEGFQSYFGNGNATKAPIFIVGMPRTGSTLVEQILCSHAQVGGLEESNAVEIARVRTGEFSLRDDDAETVKGKLLKFGAQYLEVVKESDADLLKTMTCFTNKSLSLFQYVGLIHLSLPNAKFIHIQRNVIDVCLSIFSLRFAGMGYSYDLNEIGMQYRLYYEAMKHWRSMLPEGVMLDVRYEDLVNDVEGETRRMLEFLELPWDENCLNFYQNERLVNTVSNTQVRKPIYRDSLKHWRPSKEQLKPLFDGFGSELTKLVMEQEKA